MLLLEQKRGMPMRKSVRISGIAPATCAEAASAYGNSGICRLSERLDEFNEAVAKQFSELAMALNSIAARAGAVTELSRSAADVLATVESDPAVAALTKLVSDAEDLEEVENANQAKLVSTLRALEQCRVPLARLDALPLLLRTLGTLSRIEIARRKNKEELPSLTKDTSRLAQEVGSELEGVASERERLAELLSEAIRGVEDTARQEREQASQFTGRTRAVLETMQARRQAAGVAARDIDARYASIREAIAKIVVSLQAQDITRQRSEHVQEALGQAAAAIEQGDPAAATGIIVLQRSQVAEIRKYLLLSLNTVLESLQTLSLDAQQVSAATAALASDTGEDGQKLTGALSQQLQDIGTIFARYCTSARAMLGLFARVLPSLKTVAELVDQLTRVYRSVRITALNARIETWHLGREAAAMRAIAAEMQTVSETGQQHTATLLETLRPLTGEDTFGSREDNPDISSLLVHTTQQSVGKEISRLHNCVLKSHEQASESVSQLLKSAGLLATELGKTCEIAGNSAWMRMCCDDLLRGFDVELNHLGYSAASGVQSGSQEKVTGLVALYSMQAERELHRQVMGGEPVAGSGAEGSAPENALGEGIDLF